MESPIVPKTQRANVIVALVVGVALGTAGTSLVKHDFRHRTPGLVRISISDQTHSSPRLHVDGVIQDQKAVKKSVACLSR
jgi:hypothetical protein